MQIENQELPLIELTLIYPHTRLKNFILPETTKPLSFISTVFFFFLFLFKVLPLRYQLRFRCTILYSICCRRHNYFSFIKISNNAFIKLIRDFNCSSLFLSLSLKIHKPQEISLMSQWQFLFLSLWAIIHINDMTAFFHKRRRKIIVSQHKHLKSTIYIFSIISDCHCSNRCSKYHSTILLHDKTSLNKSKRNFMYTEYKTLENQKQSN